MIEGRISGILMPKMPVMQAIAGKKPLWIVKDF
jgi:hypothetical protein